MKFLLLSVLVLMTSSTFPISKPLRILSWNIYMLPKIAPCPDRLERATFIGEILQGSDFDIVVLQEAFSKEHREIIQAALQGTYPYIYGPANDKAGIRTNSGLWILSKVPLRMIEEMEYSDCKTWDCMARKGFMIMEGDWNGKPFQIVNTHLQAENFDSVRCKQMEQLGSSIKQAKREGVQQIICGDFNSTNLSWIEKGTGGFSGPISGEAKETYDGINNPLAKKFGATTQFTVDRILLNPSIKATRTLLNVSDPYLSDHYGVICEIW